MALSVSLVLDGINVKAWDVTATADPDTIITWPHGFPEPPAIYWIVPIQQGPAAISAWAVPGVGVNIGVVKGTGVGSGFPGPQVRLYAMQYKARIVG
jgi:hypothetical protein